MTDKQTCTGCTACVAVCPRHAITMVADTEGFMQPVIDKEECVSCGLCDTVCPIHQKHQSNILQVYACRSQQEAVVKNSSSGGMFTELAKYIFQNHGVVCGCALTEDCRRAEHILIDSERDLDKLRRSKYVQSHKKDIYQQIKVCLEENKYVLFIGTPCEVAGLRSFLNKEYPHLYIVDFICHGVPSPMVWNRYIETTETQLHDTIIHANFRSKKWGWRRFAMEFQTKKGAVVSTVLTEDDYLRGFLENLYLRKSCYTCAFKGENYQSDITIGDFFAVNRVLPEMDNNEGTSLVITHTSKGNDLIKTIASQLYIIKMDTSTLQYNEAYTKSPRQNFWRENALQELKTRDFHKVIEKYCGLNVSAKLRRKISRMMCR